MEKQIRGCISCNQQCWCRRSRDYWISCLVNPSAGREFEWGGDRFTPSPVEKNIFVIGGGPAGLEVARVSAERGHHVRLAEATNALGGGFALAGLQPRRGQITDLIQWYENELGRLGVKVEFNTYIEPTDINVDQFDHIVVATGSLPKETGEQKFLPAMERLPGVHDANAGAVEDILTNRLSPGKRVVVVDELGDWRGCGTAWYLADKGHQVTLVSTDAMVGIGLNRSDANYLFRKTIAQLGVTSLTDSVVTAWNSDSATVHNMLTKSYAGDNIQPFLPAVAHCKTPVCIPANQIIE